MGKRQKSNFQIQMANNIHPGSNNGNKLKAKNEIAFLTVVLVRIKNTSIGRVYWKMGSSNYYFEYK